MKRKQHILWTAAVVLLLSLYSQTAMSDMVTIYMPMEYASVCKNKVSYVWRGKERKKADLYTDTEIFSDQRADVTIPIDTTRVYTLQLTTHDYDIDNTDIELCDECSYTNNGVTYRKPGIYDDTIATTPCPTIKRITVRRKTEWQSYDTAHSCAGDIYKWYGQQLTEYGDYIVEDADTLRHLHLIVHNKVERFDTVTICEGDAYWWMNNKYTKAGDYTISKLKTQYGCDSICHLHLAVLPVPEPVHYYATNCQGSIIEQISLTDGHSIKITKDTVYNDTIRALNMCDSVIVWHYYFKPAFFQEDIIQHFEKEPVTWHNKTFVTDTVYQDSALNRFDCDSIWQLRLITKYESFREVSRCEGDTAMHGKTVIQANTIIIDTLRTTKGADSIIHTTYKFIRPFYNRESITICENQVVEWVGHFADHKNPYIIDPVTHDSTPNYMMLEATAENSPRTFFDTYHLANGCDSTFEISVTAQKTYLKDTLVIWCNDSLDTYGPFKWIDKYGREQQWSNRNTDTIIITSLGSTQPDILHYTTGGEGWTPISGGCDSLERIHLIFTDRCSPVETIYLCPGGSVTVDGRVYTKPGMYANTMASSYNLNVPDSTHRFQIVMAEHKEVHTYAATRQLALPYEWHGKLLYQTGVYDQMLQTIHGCDSLVHLHLTVAPTKYADGDTVHFCVGKAQEITLSSGHVISSKSEEGKYVDTVQYKFFFVDGEGHTQYILGDSMVTYPLKGYKSYFFNEEAVIHKGGTYPWHKNGSPWILNKPGVYFDSCFTTVLGCDSVYRLYLREVDNWYHKDSAYVCQNELPYHWHGTDYWSEGIYFDSLPTQHDMDSVYEHHLFIYPSYQKDTIDINICQETKYAINGKVIPIQADKRDYFFCDTMSTQHGCDSIIVYHIRRTPITVINEGIHYTVEGTPYLWEPVPGTIISCHARGSYYDTIRSTVTECDSIIYTFQLEYDRPFFELTVAEICQSDGYYEWRGRRFYENTIVADTLRTKYLQLDSIYRLELTVFPTYFKSETQFICPGEGVNFGNRYLTIPGIYYDTAHTVLKGCDSIHQLILNAAPHYFFPETLTYVSNDELPLLWEGHTDERGNTIPLYGEGIYYDSLKTQVGHSCDSVYQVQVIKKESYLFERSDSICEGEYVEFFGVKYYDSGTYTKPYKTIHNVDSVYVLHLTVNKVSETRIPVYLCEGEGYTFIDTVLSKPTIYRDTLINPYTKCDSIFEVVVNWYNNSETVVNHVLCEGQKVKINGEYVNSNGVYYETLQAQYSGCDSVIKHIVTVGQPYYKEEAHVIREGDSFTWHHCGTPIVLKEEGEYWDSCKTALGCDSVMKLTLAFAKDVVIPTVYDTICHADLPYIWNTYPVSKAISSEGLHRDTCRGDGADTIRSLHLTIIPTVRTSETLEFCYGESHRINGILYTEDAVVTDTFPAKHGCDSIVTYYLKFYPRYDETRREKLTPAKPYIKITGADNVIGGDTILRTTGIYYFRYTSVHGCDSTETLIVDECKEAKYNVIQYNMCKGDALIVNGQKPITQSGTHDFHFNSIDGCDSIVRYVVKVNPSYEFTETATMCKNSSFTWRGHHNDTVYKHQGTFYDSLKTTLGCDSVYILKLTYTRTDLYDTIVSICRSDLPYRYKGELYYEDHVFYDTLANNVEGCDSVLRWNYRVNEHCSDYVHYNRCIGHYMTIDGMVISEQGTYIQHHLTDDGQDSLYRFTVHDVANYEFTTELAGCDSIVYNGKTYYARGIGQESFSVDLNHRTAEGCDSLEHLKMTIHMSSPTRVYSKTIADFDSVRFGPYFYNTTGSYPLKYTNQHGCDSIEVLNLTILETQYEDIVHYFICQGDPRGIDVFGKEIHPTKEYTFIADTTWIAGKPIIRTADIVVQKPFLVTQFNANENQIVCSAHETMFQVSYATADPQILPDYYAVDFRPGDLEGHPLHQEGTLNGKTSIDISMNGQGKYITPGYYRYYLSFRSEACTHSDTTLEGTVLVRYPADVMETAWNDAVMLVNEKYNGGGWIFKAPYTWHVYSSQGMDKTALVFNDATQPYLYSAALEEGDRISATLYREGYDQPIPTCEYIFIPQAPVMQYGILVYPSAVRSHMPATISSRQAGTYRLMDHTGRIYTTGSFHSGETPVQMPGTAGCYIMILEDESGDHIAQKMIVY